MIKNVRPLAFLEDRDEKYLKVIDETGETCGIDIEDGKRNGKQPNLRISFRDSVSELDRRHLQTMSISGAPQNFGIRVLNRMEASARSQNHDCNTGRRFST